MRRAAAYAPKEERPREEPCAEQGGAMNEDGVEGPFDSSTEEEEQVAAAKQEAEQWLAKEDAWRAGAEEQAPLFWILGRWADRRSSVGSPPSGGTGRRA